MALTESIQVASVLPIWKHKEGMIERLEKKRVLIISGDTDIGKTTQVPKYILERGLQRGEKVKIICT